MKKLLAVLLAASLLFSLVACGKDNTSSKPATTSNASTSSKTKVPTISKLPPVSLPKLAELPTGEMEKPQFPVSSEDVYKHQLVRYDLNKECRGYYATPKAKGKYPTVIIMHGQGTVEKFKTRLLSHINNWVTAGYLPPMVVVIPEIMDYDGGGSDMNDFRIYISKEYPKRFNTLLTSIVEGTLSPQIDTTKSPYVTGFSMGGMAAVHAGAEYNDIIKHVGGLSPARAFYMGEGHESGFYKYVKDIQFSKDPDTRVYLSAGRGEQDGEFELTVDRYTRAICYYNPNIVTKFIATPLWGGHTWELAQKEIFMYLYFATFDKLPTEALINELCSDPNNYKAPTVVFKEDEHK